MLRKSVCISILSSLFVEITPNVPHVEPPHPQTENDRLGVNGARSPGLGAEVKVRPQPPLQLAHFLSQTLMLWEGWPVWGRRDQGWLSPSPLPPPPSPPPPLSHPKAAPVAVAWEARSFKRSPAGISSPGLFCQQAGLSRGSSGNLRRAGGPESRVWVGSERA